MSKLKITVNINGTDVVDQVECKLTKENILIYITDMREGMREEIEVELEEEQV